MRTTVNAVALLSLALAGAPTRLTAQDSGGHQPGPRAAATASPSAPRSRPRPEDFLPAGTWLHARIAGLGGGRAAVEKSGLYKLLENKECAQLVDRAMGQAEEHIAHAIRHVREHLAHVGLAPDVVRGLLKGPIAIGLGRPTLVGPVPVPTPILVCDVAGHENDVRKLIDIGRDTAARFHARTESGDGSHLGVAYHWMGSGDVNGRVCYAFVDGFWILTLNEYGLKDAIAAGKGSAPSLAAKPAYANGRARMADEPLASLFVDIDYLLGWCERFLPYEMADIGRALGCEGVRGIYLACSPAGRGDQATLYLDAPGPEAGILKALFSKPVSCRAAALCPADVAFFGSASLDARALQGSAGRILDLLPAQARRQLERELDRGMSREVGRELRHAGLTMQDLEQVLSTLGTEVSVCLTVPPAGGFIPDGMVFVDVTDEKKAEQMLSSRLSSLAGDRLKTLSYKDRTIYYVDLPNATPVKLTPCFAFADGMLIGSVNVQTLKRTLSRGGQKDGTLATDARFAQLRKEVGRSSLMLDLRLANCAAWAHKTAMPLLENFLATHELGIDPSNLPGPQDLANAIEDVVVAFSVDKDGLTVTSRSPLGFGTMLAGAMGAADWLLERAGTQSRDY